MNLSKPFLLKIILLFIAFSAAGQEQIVSVTKLMGMTSENGGSIFSIDENGRNLRKRKSLTVVGRPKHSRLIKSNGKIWGMTKIGGETGDGVIFNMNLDGSNFSIIHEFDQANGSSPSGSLIESNGKIWGMTELGGSDNYGVIFSIKIDGSDFTTVHEFNDVDGRKPRGDLLESNGNLWGMTYLGGSVDQYGDGVIFKLSLTNLDYVVVHQFPSGEGRPTGSLIKSNGKIWGASESAIFSIDLDGSNFSQKYLTENEEGIGIGTLIEFDGRLWATARFGGTDTWGTIISISTNGSDFQKEFDFTFSSDTGLGPSPDLVVHDGKLWGTTFLGTRRDDGTIFSIDSDGTYEERHNYYIETGANPYGGLSIIDGKFWGMTAGGGGGGFGVIYTMDLDGDNYSDIHHFETFQPHYPYGDLIEHQGRLWAMTSAGGGTRRGTIFSMDIDGGDFETIHLFDFEGGSNPKGSLLISNGRFWGMTEGGGEFSNGVIFSIGLDGSDFQKVHDFDGSNGSSPKGSLIESAGKLWGMTSEGGANRDGVIFSIDIEDSEFTKVHDFNEENGKFPFGDLVIGNGKFWGMTSEGGEFDYGVIFNFNLNGTGFTKVHDFMGEGKGRTPYGSLTEYNGALWGMTSYSGTIGKSFSQGAGSIFKITMDGGAKYSLMHSLSGAGSYPEGSLTVHNDELWGMGRSGVFSYNPRRVIITASSGVEGDDCHGSLIVVTSDEVLKVPEEESALTFSVFPNPVNDNLTIRSEGDESKAIILSLTGEVVIEMKIQGESVVDLSNTPPGIYILHLMNERNNTIATRKVLKL